MTDFGYSRVSTSKQSLDHHREALIGLGVEPEYIYTDKKTGKNMNRPGLQALLHIVKKGDRVHVEKLDRLGRNLRELKDVGDELEKRGVVLVIGGRAYDPTDPMDRMFFNLLGLFAEFERDLIGARTKERLDYLREQGVQVGRKKSTSEAQDQGILKMRELGASVRLIAKTAQVSESTVNRVLSRHRTENEVQADPELLRRRKKNQMEIRKAQEALDEATRNAHEAQPDEAA